MLEFSILSEPLNYTGRKFIQFCLFVLGVSEYKKAEVLYVDT